MLLGFGVAPKEKGNIWVESNLFFFNNFLSIRSLNPKIEKGIEGFLNNFDLDEGSLVLEIFLFLD